jgi:hypothetical protein
MITCPNCQHSEYEGEILCTKCGARLMSAPQLDTQALNTQELLPLTQPLPSTESALSLQVGQIALVLLGAPQPIILEGREEYILGRGTNPEQPTEEVIDFNRYGGRERGVSRQHASLQVAYRELLLVDMQSTNGTWVNGKLLTPHQPLHLADGDEVRLGKLSLRVYFKL